MNNLNIRALAAKVVFQVLENGVSLSVALPKQQQLLEDSKDKALLAELCYGVIRCLPQLGQRVTECMSKPLTGKQRIIHQLLLVGIYQLYFTRIPAHATISETAQASRQLGFEGLVKVVNGVLRNIQRDMKPLATDTEVLQYNAPQWLINALKGGYPEKWQQIIDRNQQRPPMWLRNNSSVQTRSEYLMQLEQAGIEATAGLGDDDILLAHPTDVGLLPNFANGAVSIQDAAAQWAATLLEAKEGELVLDACAAPGGKTCHILEKSPKIRLVAVDNDENRLIRVKQNLDRLALDATIICGDAGNIDSWWQGEKFDRILLDAPCSATGVIRRHPDIQWLRKPNDILALSGVQKQLLDHCWSWLKPGGTLLYATCSMFPQENRLQIKSFLERTQNAQLQPFPQQADSNDIGWQIITGQDNMDGFYYARLLKTS